jgi:SAM-dependent methyltransferase
MEQGLELTKCCLEKVEVKHEHLGTQIRDNKQSFLQHINYLRGELNQQKKLITLFLEEAYKRLPETFEQQQIATLFEENKHKLDAFYAAFEEQFRGSREVIYQRLKVYLPLIDEANISKDDSPILDLGCGRGEWLELLKESGYVAKGIDLNQVTVEKCQNLGFDVIESEAISYLEKLPENSLGCVTGFHIIEHLPFPTLMKLFSETVRVLKPGGLAIFETPNPENTLVGSYSFYYDPTHVNPLPSPTIKFIGEYCGLCGVKILNLNPSQATKVDEDSELARRFNQYFYSSMDYAIVGYKP